MNGGFFDDLIPGGSTRRTGSLFGDLVPEETEEEKRRKREAEARQQAFRGAGDSGTFGGTGTLRRLSSAAAARESDIGANLAELGKRFGVPGAESLETSLRERAGRARQSVSPAVTFGEKATEFAGTALPDVAATMAGANLLRGAAALPGVVGRAATALVGPGRTGGTLAQRAGDVARANIAGAAAAAPLVTVPGALSEAEGQSLSAMLGVESKPARLFADILLDAGLGTALEGTVRAGAAGVRGAAGAARQFAGRGQRAAAARELAEQEAATAAQAAQEQARREAQQAAEGRLMAEPPSAISQAMRGFQREMQGYGPRALELPVREVPQTPSVRQAIEEMREPFVRQAKAERSITENAAQLEAEREAYRQTVRGTREGQLETLGRQAMAEEQAAADQLVAPTTVQQRALEALRSPRGRTALTGLAQAGGGAALGYQMGETPEEQMTYAAMFAGVPGAARNLPPSALPTLPQEVRSVGRFGFVRAPETYVLDEAIEREHVNNILRLTEPRLAGRGAKATEVAGGTGLFGGEASPNALYRFDEAVDDNAIRQTAALRGLAFGQDQQLWYRRAADTDLPENKTASLVVTGPNDEPLSNEAISDIINRVRQPDVLGEYGGATRDGDHLMFLNLKRYTGLTDEEFNQKVTQALADVATRHDIQPLRSTYYAEHLDGTAAYLRTLGREPDALRAARDAIVDAAPEYRRYAERIGADVTEVDARIAERLDGLDRLLRQVEQPPPLGRTQGAIPLKEAAQTVYTRFPRILGTTPERVVPEMVTRLDTMVNDLVDQGVIPREMAQDWYRGATLDQRAIARLALPELREDPKYTLYTVVNSILSSGQEVPVETRQGLNVFNQYLKTGRFSVLDPESVQYKQALSGGKKGLTGERGEGVLGERMAASPRTLNHEQALARLDAMVQSLGEDGTIEALVGGVPIMGPGRVVKEERPALVYLFGPKIGQYAMDKLGMPGGGKSTIDLWMARLDYALRGDKAGAAGGKMQDAVNPEMRRRMQQVLAEFATRNNMPESSAQALAWYAIKNAFRNAGAKEKRLAYTTLGSGTTEALMSPAKDFSTPIAQGLMRGETYGRAAEGWDDKTLREFARRTGREGTIQPMAGAFAGKTFDIGGALGEGLRTPTGRRIAGQAAGLAGGEVLAQSEDEKLSAWGRQIQGLTLASAAFPTAARATRAGGVKLRDAMAQTPAGRRVLNTISRDILIDPRVKELVEAAVEETAKYRAIGQELAAEARKLGPAGDRIVSDLVERESFEQAVLDPNDMAAAIALANRVSDAVAGLGQEKVGQRLISPTTFAARERSYLKRMYGKYAGEAAMEEVPTQAQAAPFRIKGEKQRLDLTPEQRNELGEIREASYRVAETFGRGGRDVASARLFNALVEVPGAVEPQYKAALDEVLAAKNLRDIALQRGDETAAREASRNYLAAKATLRNVSEQFKKRTDFVTLPDTPGLGVMRGAVVRPDVAEYLTVVPELSSTKSTWSSAYSQWKKIHTVYNSSTHVGNFVSNAAMAHLAGLPLPMQPVYLKRAADDLKAYGPATRALTERGILEKGLPMYGDQPVKGLADDKAALRALARTTRPETRAALGEQGIQAMGNAEVAARAAESKVTRAYALEDGVYRVALFQKFVNDGLDTDAAVKKVMSVLPGYDTRSPILKALKNTVSPFVLYPAKYIPAVARLILEHPERWITLTALWAGLDQASRRMFEPVEDKDLPKNQRSRGYILPGRIQVDAVARPVYKALGIELPAGDKYTFDVARWTPFSALTGSPAPGAIASQISEDIPGILQPGGPIQDIGALMLGRDPFTGDPLIEPGMTGGEKARAVGGKALGLVTPSMVSFQIPRVIKDMQRGDTAAAALDALGLVGLRPSVVKPGMQAMRERKKYEEAVQGIRSRLRLELRRNRDEERAQRLIENAQSAMQSATDKYLEAIGQRQ
jgi:hypothetical protein